MKLESPHLPAGYKLTRPLSVRNGSWVHLATNPKGIPCVLKLQQADRVESLEILVSNRPELQALSRNRGFVRIESWGVDRPTGVLWEELPIADNLLNEGRFTLEDHDVYTPLSLATWLLENRRAPTQRVIEWGIRLADALRQLHEAGLLHRDVKPANLLFFNGEPCLANYGSVGQEGSPVEFPGTEGYVPPDGLGSPAMDVFALGRTLYETWTGLDRFRFPSLPEDLQSSPDWSTHGWRLNQILLRAADGRPSERFASATQLFDELQHAAPGSRQFSRRMAIRAAIAATGAAGVFYIWRNRPSYRAVWQKLPPKSFLHENWEGTQLTCDWKNRLLYSLKGEPRGTFWQRVDLKTWRHDENQFPEGPKHGMRSIRHPESGEMWGVEKVTGTVISPGLDGKHLTTLSTQTLNEQDFTGELYWNPMTRRVGSLGGYGNFHTHNQRKEFVPDQGGWITVTDLAVVPWPRAAHFLFPDPSFQRWFLFGGNGNASGKQSDRVPGLKDYDGHFYPLNDLWELDLAANRWTQLLPVQRWRPQVIRGAVYHPGLDAVVFVSVSATDKGPSMKFHFWKRGQSGLPQELPFAGEIATKFALWTLMIEPETHDIWVFADDGVFAVSIRPA